MGGNARFSQGRVSASGPQATSGMGRGHAPLYGMPPQVPACRSSTTHRDCRLWVHTAPAGKVTRRHQPPWTSWLCSCVWWCLAAGEADRPAVAGVLQAPGCEDVLAPQSHTLQDSGVVRQGCPRPGQGVLLSSCLTLVPGHGLPTRPVVHRPGLGPLALPGRFTRAHVRWCTVPATTSTQNSLSCTCRAWHHDTSPCTPNGPPLTPA